VKVFNTVGEVELRAKMTTNVPEDFLVMYESWFKRSYNVQNVVKDTPADMGKMATGARCGYSQSVCGYHFDEGAAA
jgi:anaerobic selenocysteine-containing dehydrogenase